MTLQQAEQNAIVSAENVKSLASLLKADGGESLLVLNVPNLGLTPAYLDTAWQTDATRLSAFFDTTLATDLHNVTGMDVYLMNAYSYLGYMVANPEKYGLTDVTDPCWTGTTISTIGGTLCGTPDTYLFFDSVHPTETVQEDIMDLALTTMGIATPEPSTWLMMGLGFAELGAFGAHRARRAAIAI